jgi:POT family proton-dependent oligopeptide transporter
MAKSKYLTSPIPSKKMPAGIPYILTNEAAERFAFYGMRCILVVFMTQYLLGAGGLRDLMSESQSKICFHAFVAAVYFMGIVGAVISDIWLDKYRAILYFSLIYCVGFLALAVDQTRIGLITGLTLIVIGGGVIKPCVSANVGDQFGKTNQHLLEKIYNWFYFAINLGACISTWLVPKLLDKYGPRVAFTVPAVSMALATIAFWLGRKKFVHVPAGGIKRIKETLSGEGLKAIRKLCGLYLFVVMFWALFDQMDSAWVLLAKDLNRNWLGITWLESQIVAANPFLIMVLIPLFSYVIYPAINKIFPLTPLRKVSTGLFVAALAFAISGFIETRVVAGATPSVGWLFLAHLTIAAAEVMVSITLLEFSYTQAPKKIKSFIMALFFSTIFLGNLFTVLVNWFIQNEDGTSKLPGASYHWFFTIAMLVTAALFIPVAKRYRVKDYIQDEASGESGEQVT